MTKHDVGDEIVRFLGFKNRAQMDAAAAIPPESLTSPEELVDALPERLLAVSSMAFADNFSEKLQSFSQIPFDEAFIQKLHQAMTVGFAWLPKHPHFAGARKILVDRSTNEEPNAPFRDIKRLSSSPMLSGHRPPYLPLILIKVTDKDDEPVIDDLFSWPDLLFLSTALLDAINSHARGCSGLCENDQITLPSSELIQTILDKARGTVDQLEKSLSLFKDKGPKDDGVTS